MASPRPRDAPSHPAPVGPVFGLESRNGPNRSFGGTQRTNQLLWKCRGSPARSSSISRRTGARARFEQQNAPSVVRAHVEHVARRDGRGRDRAVGVAAPERRARPRLPATLLRAARVERVDFMVVRRGVDDTAGDNRGKRCGAPERCAPKRRTRFRQTAATGRAGRIERVQIVVVRRDIHRAARDSRRRRHRAAGREAPTWRARARRAVATGPTGCIERIHASIVGAGVDHTLGDDGR